MLRLHYHCLLLTSPSSVASGRLCFVNMAFPGYVYLYDLSMHLSSRLKVNLSILLYSRRS